MTDRNENARIALRREWFHSKSTGLWHYGNTILSYPPDYLGSWEHAGPLQEEMISKFHVDLYDRDEYGDDPGACLCELSRRDDFGDGGLLYKGTGATPTAAISRVWLAKEEGETT